MAEAGALMPPAWEWEVARRPMAAEQRRPVQPVVTSRPVPAVAQRLSLRPQRVAQVV
jgi:hypothetical protein